MELFYNARCDVLVHFGLLNVLLYSRAMINNPSIGRILMFDINLMYWKSVLERKKFGMKLMLTRC